MLMATIDRDLKRRILIESLRPESLSTMAQAALSNPHYTPTIRPRTPTWDFCTWLDQQTHFMGPVNKNFWMNSSSFNRFYQDAGAKP